MASHGKVPDLLDERYLNLQDVFGNVEPFPTLVPYEHYVQSIIVYRLNTNHELYVPLLQDFTERYARSPASAGREAWTWFVQWDVEQPSPELAVPPAAKRQRVETPLDVTSRTTSTRPGKPYYARIEPRLLHQELYLEENIQRILVDIVQVDSKFVPNYVEFLYQWVDYYEGSGRALKAALRQEIPSLWLFEFHPLPLFNANEDVGDDGLDKAAEEMGERLTKPKKPLALAELERLTEQSERLQYREVRFGIHHPIVEDDPLPPLINVPQDHEKRQQYYAACFNNRQRALNLLQEAGMTPKQIANYKKLQPMSPLETPEDINGNGFLNYYKEEPSAHAVFTENQHIRKMREKQREVAISNRLAEEARLGAQALQGNSAPPFAITPSGQTGPDHDEILAAFKTGAGQRVLKQQEPSIRYIPEPMLGLCRSNAFTGAMVKPRHQEKDASDEENMEIDTDESSGDEEYSNPDDIDPDEREDADTTAYGPPTQRPLITTPSAQPTQPIIAGNPYIARFVQNLSPAQLAGLLPRLSPQIQATIPYPRPDTTALNQVPQLLGSNPLMGPRPYAEQFRQQANIHAQLQVNSSTGQHDSPGNIAPTTATPSALPRPLIAAQSHLSSEFDSVASSTSFVRSNVYSTRDPFTTSYTIGNEVSQRAPPSIPTLSSTNGLVPAPNSFQYSPTLRSIVASNGTGWSNSYTQIGSAVQNGSSRGLPARSSPASASDGIRPVGTALGNTQHNFNNVSPELQARLQERTNVPSAGYLLGQAVGLSNTPLSSVSEHQQVDPATSGNAYQIPMISLTRNPGLVNAHEPVTNRSMVHGIQALSQAPNGLNSSIPSSTLPLQDQGLAHALRVPNEYTSAVNMPAAVSFAEILQSTNRAPRPPNLDLHRASVNQLSHITRNVNQGSPIAMTPLQQQAQALSLASPIAFRDNPAHSASPHGVPIQIYIPKVVIPHNGTFKTATDCLILGYTRPETGVLELSKAIFLPVGIWENVLRRVHRGNAQVLETYAPPPNHPRFAANKGILRNPDDVKGPHKFVHRKLTQIFGLMTSCANREQELTKRWRITPGPMTAKDRGAIWEGWAMFVDRPVELGYEERHGVGSIVSRSMDGKKGFGLSESEWREKERRMRELEEMLEEDGEEDEDEESEEDPMQE